MDNDRLTKDMIATPGVWRLALRIEQEALHVVLYSTVEDNSLIYRVIPLDKAIPSQLRRVEEAIYNNPLLLSDFTRVYCVVATDCYLVTPAEMAGDADDCEALLKTAFPDFNGDIISNSLGATNATLLMGLDRELAAFLNRTFVSPRVCHPLSPLSRYFIGTAGRGNNARMYAHLRGGSIDIIAADKGALLLANTFRFNTMSDAAYYVMACRRQLGMSDTDDELYIAGDPTGREQLATPLRQYLARVLPAIFPSSMYMAGGQAMCAPYDLIVLPLCD